MTRWKMLTMVSIAIVMVTSIAGMCVRYVSHRKSKHKIQRAERKAESD